MESGERRERKAGVVLLAAEAAALMENEVHTHRE